MKKLGVLLTATAIIIGLVYIDKALAHRFGKGQIQHQVRIDQGTMTGELTRGQACPLDREQRHIQKQRRTACCDGECVAEECPRMERRRDCAGGLLWGVKKSQYKMCGNLDSGPWNR